MLAARTSHLAFQCGWTSDRDSPSSDDRFHSSDDDSPLSDDGFHSSDDDSLSSDDGFHLSDDDSPLSDDGFHSSDDDSPSSDDGFHSSGRDCPSSDDDSLSSDDGFHLSDDDSPLSDEDSPSSDDGFHSSERDSPSSDDRRTKRNRGRTNGNRGSLSSDRPCASRDPASTSFDWARKCPESPASSDRSAVAGGRIPATSRASFAKRSAARGSHGRGPPATSTEPTTPGVVPPVLSRSSPRTQRGTRESVSSFARSNGSLPRAAASTLARAILSTRFFSFSRRISSAKSSAAFPVSVMNSLRRGSA
jgi:hypothetical protein